MQYAVDHRYACRFCMIYCVSALLADMGTSKRTVTGDPVSVTQVHHSLGTVTPRSVPLSTDKIQSDALTEEKKVRGD